VCQRNKTKQLQHASLLQLLALPTVWANIAMDFVEVLLHVNEKSVIL
jgi:hypothetical protein